MKPDAHPAPLPAILAGKTVAILGAGKVGRAVGMLLREAGVPISAVTARSAASAEEASARTGGEPGTDNAAAAATGDIVLVTTNDDSIAGVVAEVAEEAAFRPGQLVAHMSGALRLTALEPAAEAGAMIGSAHPLQSFATADQAVREIRGSVFGLTAGPGARGLLEALVGVLEGYPVAVDDDKKAVYHAAAVMASNYLVAVEDMAALLLVDAGFDEATAARALQPLVRGTMDNIRELGTTNALTGPIVRGDIDTVRRHVRALEGLPGDGLRLYRALGRHALAIARRRGTLDAGTLEGLRDALGAENAG